ncbi:MAG: hypothetical protein MUO31_12350 [Thermodesulfovibrionales bacterium]|nr:hypothetical protein [Thermodesulfovibrionales bacterium]
MIKRKPTALCDQYHPRVNIFKKMQTGQFFEISDDGFLDSFLADGLNRINEMIIAPAIMPQSAERNMTIARDASNPQKRKVIATGTAFCTEKIATRNNTINNIIIVAMDIPSILPKNIA